LVRKLFFKNENQYFFVLIDNEKTFTEILFYGEESSLLFGIWLHFFLLIFLLEITF